MNAKYFILFSFLRQIQEERTQQLFVIQDNALSSTCDPMAAPYRFLLYPALCKVRDGKGELASSTIVLAFFCPIAENGSTLVITWVSNLVSVAFSRSTPLSKEPSG